MNADTTPHPSPDDTPGTASDPSGRSNADVDRSGFTAERVRRHLRASTDHLDLVVTPVARVHDRAGQRTARRQRLAAIGAAAAVSVVAVAGVSMLGRSGPSSVVTSDTDSELGIDSTPASDVPSTEPAVAPPSTDTSTVGGPASTTPLTDDAVPDPFGDLGAAVETDPAFVWKVVDPGKEASISSVFNGSELDGFPAFALSTAPGRSNDYDNIETFLYRTEDGISWSRTAAQSPFTSNYWNAQVNADRIFVTGTLPGIARTEPNPLQIAVGSGDAWDIAELPIDTNADASLPMVVSTGPQVSSAPYGDGVLVIVTTQSYPDYEAIIDLLGVDANDSGILDQQRDGVTLVDGACLDAANSAYDPTDELFGPDDGQAIVPTTIVSGGLEDGDDYFGCPVTKRTWEELGMPPASIDALTEPTSRFFTVSPSLQITEIEGPGEGDFFPVSDSEPIVESAAECCSEDAPPRYELVEGAWTESPGAANTILTRQGIALQQLGDRRMGLFGTQSDGRVPFMTIAADGSQNGVDLRELLETDAAASSSWSDQAATTASHWVGAVQTYADPIAEQGGVEVSFGDVIVRQATQQARFELLDAATREPIDRSLVSGTDNGTIQVLRPDGTERAEFHVEDVYRAVQQASNVQPTATHSIVTTTDGTSFSVESVAALLGLTDGDVSRVARVASDGSTVIVTVTLTERYPDESPKQLVLVGTPIG